MTIQFLPMSYPTQGCVVVFCYEGKKLSPAALHMNRLSGEVIEKALSTSNFKGKLGQTLSVTPAGSEISKIIVLGVGKPEELTAQSWTILGGDLYSAVGGTPVTSASVILELDAACKVTAQEAASCFAEGFELKNYKFDKYKSPKPADETPPEFDSLAIYTNEAVAAGQAFDPLHKRAQSVAFTRDLVSELPNILYPESYADQLSQLSSLGLKVTVLTRKDMEKLGMNSLLAVGMGSEKEERLVCLEWHGGVAGDAPLAFVGKGVTFDTGGISIKPAANMHDMKYDMAGSAVVAGLMRTLAARKAKVNAVGVVGLVENMPSGKAQRPGDVVKAMSGTTIECLNTDAEGRMVLADAVWYTQDVYKPKFVIDLATLTGAVLVALGDEIAGIFTNDKELGKQLFLTGEEVGEKVWELPMDKLFDDHIKSDVADIKNIGKKGMAGSISGAKFIERFIKKGTPWAHIDIAGVSWTDANKSPTPKGATGYGVRLLDTLVKKYYEVA